MTQKRKLPLGLFTVVLCIALTGAGSGLIYADMSRDYRHGVYRCENGRMLEEPAEPDMELIRETAAGIGEVWKSHPGIGQYMMLVPAAACIQNRYLPQDASVHDQKKDLADIRRIMPSSLTWIDLIEAFDGHEGEKLYYATDVWLTGWGSRYAAKAALEVMGAETFKSPQTCYLLSDSFTGTLEQDHTFLRKFTDKKNERLEIYVPDEEALYYRVDVSTGKKYGSLYDSGAVTGTDQYNVFFGGETALTEIHTSAVNGETLLVIGDRTADSVVPLFVSSFEKIIFVHPSKYTGTVESLIKKYRPGNILYLYGANSFFKDGMLQHVLPH